MSSRTNCNAGLLTCPHRFPVVAFWEKQSKKKMSLPLLCLPPGANPPLPGRLDGPLDVGPRHGSRQLLHPLPDCPGWPAGDRLPRPLLPHALVHRRQRHKHGQLNAHTDAHRKKNNKTKQKKKTVAVTVRSHARTVTNITHMPELYLEVDVVYA